jgi:hypothetical protein
VAIYKATTTAQQKNRTIHFILLIHCLAQLPFDYCIYPPQQVLPQFKAIFKLYKAVLQQFKSVDFNENGASKDHVLINL